MTGSNEGPPLSPGPNDKLTAVQLQVDTVKETMAQNIELVLKRGDDLDRMNMQTEGLQDVAKTFKQTTVKVKKQQAWAKYRWYICCTAILCVVFSGVITAIVVAIK